jgi:hypothetical protein
MRSVKSRFSRLIAARWGAPIGGTAINSPRMKLDAFVGAENAGLEHAVVVADADGPMANVECHVVHGKRHASGLRFRDRPAKSVALALMAQHVLHFSVLCTADFGRLLWTG